MKFVLMCALVCAFVAQAYLIPLQTKSLSDESKPSTSSIKVPTKKENETNTTVPAEKINTTKDHERKSDDEEKEAEEELIEAESEEKKESEEEEIEEEVEEHDDRDDEDEDSIEEPDVSLNCIMFGQTGCEAHCRVLADLYDSNVNSSCDKKNRCTCSRQIPKEEFPNLWRNLFGNSITSKRLLKNIMNNEEDYKKAVEIMQQFPQTFKDVGVKIRDTFSNFKNIHKLQPKPSNLPITQFIKKYEIDFDGLEEYVDDKMQNYVKNLKTKPINFIEKMKHYFDQVSDSEKQLDHIINKIRDTDNRMLKKLLDRGDRYSYRDSQKSYSDSDDISKTVSSEVTNNLIEFYRMLKQKQTFMSKTT